MHDMYTCLELLDLIIEVLVLRGEGLEHQFDLHAARARGKHTSDRAGGDSRGDGDGGNDSAGGDGGGGEDGGG